MIWRELETITLKLPKKCEDLRATTKPKLLNNKNFSMKKDQKQAVTISCFQEQKTEAKISTKIYEEKE